MGAFFQDRLADWPSVVLQDSDSEIIIMHPAYQQPATFNSSEVSLYILYNYSKYLYISLISGCLYMYTFSS
jgi:hypothetical protein